MEKKTKLSVVIPVYNEMKTVDVLLNRVYKHKIDGIEKELIIVESNSRDGSRRAVELFAKGKKDVKLILQDRALGKGTAVRAGLEEATGDIILIQDADLEYEVSDYERLVGPIVEGKADFVLGSRHLNYNGGRSWMIRRFAGKERIMAHVVNVGGLFFHGLFNLVYGVRLTDPTTMYKVFRRELLDEVHLEGSFFELDWEIVGKFIRMGHVPLEVPVKYKSRGYAEGKKVQAMRDITRWLWTIFKYRLLPKSQL